jgi:hypothetical protein
MRKTILLILMASAAALVALVGAAGSSTKERPFRATFQGHTTSIKFANPANPIDTSTFGGRCSVPSNWMIFFEGTGNATHLGQFTWTSAHCTQIGTNPPATVTVSDGRFDYVAANGDLLFEEYGNGQFIVLTPTLACLDTAATFAGGTGRFEHAAGSALEHACWNPSVEPGPAVSDLRIASRGTISYDASDRAG